jgi:protein involved in polysaccharide export with SLBB domain
MSSLLVPPPRDGRCARRTPRGSAVALALVVLAAACSAPPLAEEVELPAAAPAPLEVRRRLAFDDVVRVDVYEQPGLSTGPDGRRIDYEGNLDLPLLGPVFVVGLSISEARALLEERAARFVKRPSVAVTVVAYAPRLFYVLGEVQASGAYEISAPTTALQAVARAGGLTRLADREEVVVLRARDGKLSVHRFDAATPGADGHYAIEPGDLIFVRESGAGTFQQQIMPYLQGLAPPFTAAASLFLVADNT